MYECPNCSDSYDTEKALKVHISWCEDKRGNMSKEHTCKHCSRTFEDYNDRKFCSRKCKDESQKSGKMVECNWCGDEVYKSPSHFGKIGDYSIDNHFCDKRCEQSWKRQHWTGENHPSWNGGSPSYRGKSWPEIRREAIDRDGYCCAVCDMSREEHYEQYGRDLDVHHKIPSRTFEQVDDANYLINLVTTCMSCHGKLDRISRREADRKPTIPA